MRAIVARSFERIHRSNLIGMGIFPLQFAQGDAAEKYRLTGEERLDVIGLDRIAVGNNAIPVSVTRIDGSTETIDANLRIDSEQELDLPAQRRHPALRHPQVGCCDSRGRLAITGLLLENLK